MEAITLFLNGCGTVFSLTSFSWIIFGTMLGLLVGAVPGFTSSMATGLLLPITFAMEPVYAMIFLISVYISAIYGGSITAILLNTPGTPESSATTFDGYELTQKGMGNEALGVAFFSSAMGGLMSYTAMLFMMTPFAKLALKFGPPEMFLIALLGVSVLAVMATTSPAKVLISGLFGLLLGTMGVVPTGEWRATFGSLYLTDGIQVVPAIVGFFAMSEVFNMAARDNIIKSGFKFQCSIKAIIRGMFMAMKYPKTIFRSAFLGFIIGIIPAAGASVAAFVGYGEAKRLSKTPELFGTGTPEGVCAPETANNASTGGDLITTFALGVPGSSTCAVLMGALMIQGLRPGPQLLREQMPLIYTIIAAAIIAQAIMIVMSVAMGYTFTHMMNVSTKILAPCLIFFCIVGAFAVRSAPFDVWIMLAFGVMGWFMRRSGYSLAAAVLGVVLGAIADNELIRTYTIFGSDTPFCFFNRPLSLVILGFILLGFFHREYTKRKANKSKEAM